MLSSLAALTEYTSTSLSLSSRSPCCTLRLRVAQYECQLVRFHRLTRLYDMRTLGACFGQAHGQQRVVPHRITLCHEICRDAIVLWLIPVRPNLAWRLAVFYTPFLPRASRRFPLHVLRAYAKYDTHANEAVFHAIVGKTEGDPVSHRGHLLSVPSAAAYPACSDQAWASSSQGQSMHHVPSMLSDRWAFPCE